MSAVAIKQSNYENIIAECPKCFNVNTFNRKSDLGTTDPIDHKEMNCLECKAPFNINGGLICENYKYMILDGNDLLSEKRYMYCVLNACQAFEMFFYAGIKTRLLHQPFENGCITKDEYNRLSEKLYTTFSSYPFNKLRSIFLDIYVYDRSFSSYKEIEAYISNLNSVMMLKLVCITSSSINPSIQLYLDLLHKTIVHEIRNKTLHKYGYRPSLEDATSSLIEARKIIFNLKSLLEIRPLKPNKAPRS